ncbi:MAG: sugar ABC transporter ATP-binding protein [Treponema sp.]|jgi:ribose transport system ATP-binding protein|nr:sugar ABC transporter ATP-binding protein [Treponema sp.]
MPEVNRVEMRDIVKQFGGTIALNHLSLTVKPGEIHCLVGENGAGKSTLVKILSGAVQKDSGEIVIDGTPVEINGPRRGRELGISIIYQEFALAQDLTVAENIFLNKLGIRGVVNWKRLNEKAKEVIQSIGIDIDPAAKVKNLSVAYQQVVEIAKALSEKSCILILDEPTAVLTPQDVSNLFIILDRLKKQGVSIIYISHRLEEVFLIADTITIMRDGSITGSFPKESLADSPVSGRMDKIVKLMVGRELTSFFPKRESAIGEEILRVENFNSPAFSNISFKVHRGEVIGFAGLVGSGRTETARAVFGADKITGGRLFLANTETVVNSPKKAVGMGIGLVPESRKTDGLILPMMVRENISFANLKKVTGSLGRLLTKKEIKNSTDLVKSLSIKTNGVNAPVMSLSGGNQQKVVLAKWFNTEEKVIILDEPTRGVDVGAKVDIYSLINNFAQSGLGVIMISSEMTELIGMCDRVYVYSSGRIIGELMKPDISEQNIMQIIVSGGHK